MPPTPRPRSFSTAKSIRDVIDMRDIIIEIVFREICLITLDPKRPSNEAGINVVKADNLCSVP